MSVNSPYLSISRLCVEHPFFVGSFVNLKTEFLPCEVYIYPGTITFQSGFSKSPSESP